MKLRPYRSDSVGREATGYEFWCPGCAKTHPVMTWVSTRSHFKLFEFNGDPDHPTFHPNVQTLKQEGEWINDGLGGQIWIPTARQVPYCVVHVFNGTLRYSRASGHYLANQTVRMQDIPTTREERTDMTNMSKQRQLQFLKGGNRCLVVVGVGFVFT